MQSIISRSIPLKEVITDLARQLGTRVHNSCNEYSLDIPETFGAGSIKALNFQGGMGIIIYDCTFRFDLEIKFIVDQVHPLKFIFCETGNLNHRFQNETQFHNLQILENVIVASCQNNGHIIHFEKNVQTKINSLEIDREKFVRVMDCELKSLESSLENLFRDINANEAFYHHGQYSFAMADLFIELGDNPKKDFLGRMILEGAAFRMLTQQIFEYNDDLKDPRNKSVLRKFEIKQVLEATAIIKNEILDFKTVNKLALVVGLNSNKLQNGFKELYGTTVNDYVHQRRLDVAKSLLKSSEFTISEIVYMIGLSSKSYFSKIFKEKYGLPPSIVRQDGKAKNRISRKALD